MTLDSKSLEKLERGLKRSLTEEEKAIAEACGPALLGIAHICIEEKVPVAAAGKLAAYVGYLLDVGSRHAAKIAGDLVVMERLAPGSTTDDGGKHGH